MYVECKFRFRKDSFGEVHYYLNKVVDLANGDGRLAYQFEGVQNAGQRKTEKVQEQQLSESCDLSELSIARTDKPRRINKRHGK